MAEAVSLGASIITFAVIATRLSKAAKDAWDSVKDAPEEIARVIHKLGNLECLLNEIQNQDTSTANSQAENPLARLWTSQSDQLKRDFAIYQELADKLALRLRKDQCPISSARAKFQWFIKQDTVRELDRRLQENIGTFLSILRFLTLYVPKDKPSSVLSMLTIAESDTVRSSSFDLQELRFVGARSAESITNLEPIIEQALASLRSDFWQSLQRAFPFGPQVSKASMARNPAGSTVSIRFDRWYTYELPFGTLRVTRGVKKLGWNKSWRYGPTSGSTDEETTSGIMFDFLPAPWLMAKAVTGTFVLHYRKYNDLPGLTHMISTANVLPKRNRALGAAAGGGVSQMQEIFSKGLASPNDRNTQGESLLHIAAAEHHYEMCALLIREGADCNAVDDHGRTPLHSILGNKSQVEKDQTVALMDLLVNNGNDPTTLSRHGISAFTHDLAGTMESTIFGPPESFPDDFDKLLKVIDDFEEIDEFDPIPLTMSLCAVHSGRKEIATKVEPAVKKWLKNHHKQGFINLGDAGALQVLAFQALQHRAPELTANQAGVVLQFAFNARCSVDVIRALVRPGTVNGDGIWDDWIGEPVLELAAEWGDLEVVDILLDAGADGQASNLAAFKCALQGEHHHVVERFLEHFLGCEELLIRALNIVILYGPCKLDLVKCFIERTPDLSVRVGLTNRTLLFTAAAMGDMELVELLIESGIDVLARDYKGWTASAISKSNKDVTEYLKREEDKARLKNRLKGIPDDLELDSSAVLAMAVSKTDPRQKLSTPASEIDPDFGITEEVYQSEPVHHALDSWGSLGVLTTEDVALIVSGLCVTLVGASYVFVANSIRFLWRNRKYMTVRNVKWMGWFAGLMLSLASWIATTRLTSSLLYEEIGYSAGKKGDGNGFHVVL